MKKITFCVLTAAAAVASQCAIAGISVVNYDGHYAITNATDSSKDLKFALQDAGSSELICANKKISNNAVVPIIPGQKITCTEKQEATTAGTIYYASTITIENEMDKYTYYGTIGIPSEFYKTALDKAVANTTVWAAQMPVKSADSKNEISVTIK
jgi:hypothetical protein